MKSTGPKPSSQEENESTLVQRLKQKKVEQMQSDAETKGTAKFSDGVGYQVLRG